MNRNPSTDLDLLVHRAVEGRLDDAGWAALEAAADREPGLWRRLALTWRDQADLEDALAALPPVPARPPGRPRRGAPTAGRLSSWSGWLVAAALLAAWLLRPGAGSPPVPASGAGAEPTLAAGTPDEAGPEPDRARAADLEAGRRSGRLLREYPPVVVGQRPAPGGQGTELLVLRRLLERQVVDQLYELHPDDSGRPVAVPVRHAALPESERL